MSPIQGVKPHAQGSETLSMNRSCKIPHLCEESHYWQVSIRNGTHSSFSREKAKVRVSPAKQITVKETSQIRFKLTKGFDHLRSVVHLNFLNCLQFQGEDLFQGACDCNQGHWRDGTLCQDMKPWQANTICQNKNMGQGRISSSGSFILRIFCNVCSASSTSKRPLPKALHYYCTQYSSCFTKHTDCVLCTILIYQLYIVVVPKTNDS